MNPGGKRLPGGRSGAVFMASGRAGPPRLSGLGLEAGRDMGAVAEGLSRRSAAAAERHPVPPLILEALCRFDGDAALDPQGTGETGARVLDDADPRSVTGLDGLSGLLVPGHQGARGAIAGLLDRFRSVLGVVGG